MKPTLHGARSCIPLVWRMWGDSGTTEGESYCEDSLMRFKPVRALADVKGNHATYSAAMIAFLEHPHCPAGLQRQVARARLDHAYRMTRRLAGLQL